MSFPFWDWRRSNGGIPVERSRLDDYNRGYEDGLKVAECLAEWMHGQDKKKAMEHIENVRKILCE